MFFVMPHFGDWVRVKRAELGWKQGDLAKRLHKNQPWISRIENGLDTLSVAEVAEIGEVLGDVDGALEAAKPKNQSAVREARDPFGTRQPTNDELELLEAYRGLDENNQRRAKAIMEALKTAEEVHGDENPTELHSRKDGG